LSLIGDDLNSESAPPPPAASTATAMDLLSNIFSGTSISPTAAPPAAVSPAASTPGASLLDMLGESKPVAASSSSASGIGLGINLGTPQPPAGYVAIDKGGFRVSLEPSKDSSNPDVVNIRVNFFNAAVGATVENLLLQIAVPKVTCRLKELANYDVSKLTWCISSHKKSNFFLLPVRLWLPDILHTKLFASQTRTR
jgi:hypothetical protein